MTSRKYPLSLSQPVYSAKQVLQNEALVAKKLNIAMPELMERAGAATFKQVLQSWPILKSMLVICGKGNNGGDGFVVARLAHLAGINVLVLSLNDELTQGNASLALKKLQSSGVKIIKKNESLEHDFEQVITRFSGELIVDGIFGIGFHGQLHFELKKLIKAINLHTAEKLSIDIPSGLSADTGCIDSVAVNADVTISFIVLKMIAKRLLKG